MTASRILVVDDEADIRGLLKEILAEEGYEVEVAADATQARTSRATQVPDLVLLDIWMPDTDGITLAARMVGDRRLRLPGGHDVRPRHGRDRGRSDAAGRFRFRREAAVADQAAEDRRARTRCRAPQAPVRAHARFEPGRPDRQEQGHAKPARAGSECRLERFAGACSSANWAPAARHTRATCTPSAPARRSRSSWSSRRAWAPDPAAALFGSERDGKVDPGRIRSGGGRLAVLERIGGIEQRSAARAARRDRAKQLHARGRPRAAAPQRALDQLAPRTASSRATSPEPFRRDLMAHLNVITLRVPPLRDYAEDVPDLLRYYVDRLVDDQHLPLRRFGVAAQNRLRNYPWPGNLSELKNLVQRVLDTRGRRGDSARGDRARTRGQAVGR